MQGLFQCGGAFHYPMVSFKTLSPNKDRFECSSWTAVRNPNGCFVSSQSSISSFSWVAFASLRVSCFLSWASTERHTDVQGQAHRCVCVDTHICLSGDCDVREGKTLEMLFKRRGAGWSLSRGIFIYISAWKRSPRAGPASDPRSASFYITFHSSFLLCGFISFFV